MTSRINWLLLSQLDYILPSHFSTVATQQHNSLLFWHWGNCSLSFRQETLPKISFSLCLLPVCIFSCYQHYISGHMKLRLSAWQDSKRKVDRDHWVRLMTSTQWAQIKMSTSNTTDKALGEGRSAAPLGKTRDRPDKAQFRRSENKHLTVRNPHVLVFTTGTNAVK